MGGVADGVVKKVNRLANVQNHGNVLSVGMAEAARSPGAEMENIAVHK